ncbi:hypothetical protein AB0C12_02955 [Actinoplanes sp. NPDC048967]|uniref:hypothetical protein n=1 Tax=Actinoplanes sp. NPDC048967 TaxID=3155269 RepID=UPI0033CC674F
MRRAVDVEDPAAPDGQPPVRGGAAPASTAIAGVVATAAGATAIPQLLGVFANVAQVATLARSDLLFVVNIVIVVLGLIALFGPGQAKYRESLPRVIAAACAVIVCGTLAGIGLSDRLKSEPAPAEAAAPDPSRSGPPASRSVVATPGKKVKPTATAIVDPVVIPGAPQEQPAAREVTSRPTSRPSTKAPIRKAAVSASMSCTPSSCETSEKIMALGGAFSGALAAGHQLMLFVQAPDGRHYPGSKGLVSGSRWSGKVHVGSDNGQEASFTYAACLYDINQTFAADLDARSDTELNAGLTRIPTSGTAVALACEQLRWNRP